MNEKKQPRKAASAPKTNTGPMDVGLLESIVKLMQANDLNTVELRDGDRRVTLKRGPVNASMPVTTMSAPMASASQGAKAGELASSPQAALDESTKWNPIKSPMVGTFYSKPSPDAKPFVTLGSAVTEDTDVGVIEAMKVFNNVQAGCQGTISRIVVNDGQAVEFGQVLYLVKP